MHGYANAVDTKVTIGGTVPGSSGQSGATFDCDISIDIGGTGDTADVVSVNSGGNTMSTSRLYISSNTTSSALPTAWYAAGANNTIVFGTVNRLDTPTIEGALNFAYTDGVQTFNNITRDGSGLFAQQKVSSSANTQVFGVKDLSGNKDFIVFNNGGFYSAAIATASSVATIKKALYFYDSSGNVEGYIPIYTTFS